MDTRTGYRLPALALLVSLTCGCIPGIHVRKNPGPRDRGIRYYRPKPYLLITPIESVTTVQSRPVEEVISIATSGEFVQLQLQYLPDFSEEYSITVTPGLGSADVEFTLENGWNLQGLNQDLDSQFDENVSAIAELADASAFTRQGTPGGDQVDRRWVVRASNVPLGYYESVINRDPAGQKRLYGWRYVGFTPYGSCPLTICGDATIPCGGHPLGPIFGLVFEEGVMTFRPLHQVHADPTRMAIPTGSVATALP